MILAMLGLLAIAGTLYFKEEDREEGVKATSTGYIRTILIFVGFVLIASDAYAQVILPSQLSHFYNGGSGLTYSNTTMFDSNDTAVAYFMGYNHNEFYYIELLKGAALWTLPLLMLFLIWRYLGEHNISGKKVASGREKVDK